MKASSLQSLYFIGVHKNHYVPQGGCKWNIAHKFQTLISIPFPKIVVERAGGGGGGASRLNITNFPDIILFIFVWVNVALFV
jgi:hypothetical protein